MSTALITGASRGLGAAVADALVQRGWTVIITARDDAALQAKADALTQAGHVIAVAGDVADASHRAVLADTAALAGGVDLLVNNASDLGPTPLPRLVDYPLDRLEAVLRTNAVAPLALVQALLPQLRADATIVNVTSDAGTQAFEGWGGYGASKAALDQLTAVLAVELPALRIYTFDPGDMRTRMHQDAFPGEDISDRPEPETVVPALLVLVDAAPPSGRYNSASVPALGSSS